MSLNFSFATAGEIIFGNNSLGQIAGIVKNFGKKALIVSGNNSENAQRISQLINQNAETVQLKVISEPTTEIIENGVEFARQHGCDLVVGVGGGSVIDSAKAIAALVPNKGKLFEYLEVIGKGKPLIEKPLPCIAIPTTAGTGAEVTKNSVIKSTRHKVKVSLRSNLMYPNVAVIDPVLTYSMPPELTASTGVDALTHLLETYVSNQSNGFIDKLCEEGLKRISRSLLNAYFNANNATAREDMAFASMLGGMALANVKLGAVHGFAGPMGGMFAIKHGEICACLMAAVIETNVEVLTKKKMDTSKFDKLATLLTGNPEAVAKDAVAWIKDLVEKLKIPTLSKFGITNNDFTELITNAKNASSMKGNPVHLNDDELTGILEKSL